MSTVHKDGSILAHRFEKAGLGIAPFRYIGMTTKWYNPCPGSLMGNEGCKPGGTCDYCGMGILYVSALEMLNFLVTEHNITARELGLAWIRS